MANTNDISVSKTFIAGLWQENPVLRLLLGMCPTLAVTAAVKPALTMGCSVIFVLICSNIVVSLMRNLLKPHLRILMFTLTIATFVTIADLFLKAYVPNMSETLGPYVPLIIVNCIIICRAEACASQNGLVVSIIDALGMGLGFTATLCVLAGIRELLATGKVFEITVLSPVSQDGWFTPWAAMGMPVGAFVTLGLLLGLVNLITKKQA
ncbi:MAG: electron transport complex subunit RsxE [Planctomycetes bacterium]|nr:electron transport complex subunit RsxE [Planctomycetota bacterium]